MIKAPIFYTGFKTPETVELSDSDLALLRAHDHNAKSIIMKAHRMALWERFEAQFPASYNLARGFKWGAILFLVLFALFFFAKPFPESDNAAIIALSLSAFCGMMRIMPIGWQLTYTSYKSLVKTHLELLNGKIDQVKLALRAQQQK